MCAEGRDLLAHVRAKLKRLAGHTWDISRGLLGGCRVDPFLAWLGCTRKVEEVDMVYINLTIHDVLLGQLLNRYDPLLQ